MIALYIQNAYNILMFAWSFYAASAGIPAFAALFWKKATHAGILSAMLAGFSVCVGWRLAGEPFGFGLGCSRNHCLRRGAGECEPGNI